MREERYHQMDPKEYEAYLAANRRRKRRRKGNRSLVAGIFISFALLVCAAVFVVFFLRVNTFEIQANGLASNSEILAAAGIQEGDNLLLVPTKEAAEAIYQLNPEIDSCTVSRVFPTQVTITLIKGVPTLQAETAVGYAILSQSGRVMRLSTQKEENLPIIRGLKSPMGIGSQVIEEEGYQLAAETVALLQSKGMQQTNLVDVRDIYDINVLYDSRVRLILGNGNDLKTKVSTVCRTLQSQFAGGEQGVIDGSVALHQAGVRMGASHLEYFDLQQEQPDQKPETESDDSDAKEDQSDAAQPPENSTSGDTTASTTAPTQVP